MDPTVNNPNVNPMLSGLSEEQRRRAQKIVELGKMFGGTEDMDQYFMGQLMNTFLPQEENNEIDVLASAYGLTEDPAIKDLLTTELYGEVGIDPQQQAEQNAMLQKFSGEFGDSDQYSYYEQMAKQNPELMEQYFSQGPEEEKFKWGKIPAYAGAGAAAGGVAGSVVPLFGNAAGAIGGGAIGGITGLIDAIIDKKNESPKEKEERLKKLLSQYESNIPSN